MLECCAAFPSQIYSDLSSGMSVYAKRPEREHQVLGRKVSTFVPTETHLCGPLTVCAKNSMSLSNQSGFNVQGLIFWHTCVFQKLRKLDCNCCIFMCPALYAFSPLLREQMGKYLSKELLYWLLQNVVSAAKLIFKFEHWMSTHAETSHSQLLLVEHTESPVGQPTIV